MSGRFELFLKILPSIAFSLVLLFWINGTFDGPGENYWPILTIFGLLVLNCICALVFLIAGINAKRKGLPTSEWWMPAVAARMPALFVLAFYTFPRFF